MKDIKWSNDMKKMVYVGLPCYNEEDNINVLINIGDWHIASGSDDYTVRIW